MSADRSFAIALVVAALCTRSAAAADAPPKDAAKGFEISVVVTDKGDAVFDTWDSGGGKRFDIPALKLAPRGKFLSALLMFKACAPAR